MDKTMPNAGDYGRIVKLTVHPHTSCEHVYGGSYVLKNGYGVRINTSIPGIITGALMILFFNLNFLRMMRLRVENHHNSCCLFDHY